MSAIGELAAALPECYQPVYGHPELDAAASRDCRDRLARVEKIVAALAAHYGRPLRILDLGCAQGFFAFSLARHCERVVGVDALDKNIRLCEALGRESAAPQVSFQNLGIQETVRGLKPGEFDLVLGFSVFHHICHDDGFKAARETVDALARKADVLLLELALKEEPAYWAHALPDKPEEFVKGVPFTRVVAEFPTHLSGVRRPLFYCSRNVWHFEKSTERFLSWAAESHELARGAHRGTRRYYRGEKSFAKTYRITRPGDGNERDSARELRALGELRGLRLKTLHVPSVVDAGKDERSAYLVAELVEGRRLSELIDRGEPYDAQAVVASLLDALVELESHGLCHDDVRVWNILVGPDGRSRLIDFGAVSARAQDVVWPHDPFASFLLFAVEACRGAQPRVTPLRAPLFSPVWSNGVLHAWFNAVWATPRSSWSFKSFQELLKTARDRGGERSPLPVPVLAPENIVYWMGLIESLLHEATDVFNYAKLAAATRRAENARRHAEDEQRRAEDATRRAEARAERAEARVALIESGLSWRLTSPLRALKSLLKNCARPRSASRRSR